MLPHPLTNFKKQKYQNEPQFNGVYSRNNLTKIMDGAYLINLDEYESVGTHWKALYVNESHNVTYFDNFRVSYSKEIKNSYLAKILEQVVKTSIICDKYRKFKNPKIYVLEK